MALSVSGTAEAPIESRLTEDRTSLHDPVTTHVSLASASSSQGTLDVNEQPPRQTLTSLKKAATKLAHKVRPHPFVDESRPILNGVRHDAAFNPTKVKKELDARRTYNAEMAANDPPLHGVLHAIAHPRKAVKQKLQTVAAEQLVSESGPLTSNANEVQFLDAADAVRDSRRCDAQVGLTDSEGRPLSHDQLLEDRRDSLRAAWVTSHLRRIGVVGRNVVSYPERKAFTRTGEKGKISFEWLNWVGHVLLYFSQDFSFKYIDEHSNLTFDTDTTREHVERLIMSSGNWQAWAMDVRSVYRWENPMRTLKWYILYATLWYTNTIMAFLWAYVIYHVLSNKYSSHSDKNVKDAAQRALDRESTAFQIGELMDRHGQNEWLDPLIHEVGPPAQLQLGDLADLLEVMQNFYAWKLPRKTGASLFFFGACLVITLVGSVEFCMRMVWFIVGNTFFVCWPIASRYPEYRLLVSPFRWVFWDIPTHAESSFQYLRNHAQISREDMIFQKVEENYNAESQDSMLEQYAGHMDLASSPMHKHRAVNGSLSGSDEDDDDDDDDDWHSATSASHALSGDDMLSFRAHYAGTTGRLYIYSNGIRFVRSFPRSEVWNLPYKQIAEMQKVGIKGHRKVTLGGLFDGGALELKSLDDTVWTLDPIKYRDEAFNCILGFSGLQWQALRPTDHKDRGRHKT